MTQSRGGAEEHRPCFARGKMDDFPQKGELIQWGPCRSSLQYKMLRNTPVYLGKKSLSSRLLKALCVSCAVRHPDAPRFYIPEQEQKRMTR